MAACGAAETSEQRPLPIHSARCRSQRPASARRPETPYLDALRAYADREPGRFHVPGHKGGAAADPRLIEAFGEQALALDIPALTAGHRHRPGADPVPAAPRSWPPRPGARGAPGSSINGASQGNHAACLTLAQAGEQVVVQRNVHSSTIDGW